MLDYCTDAARSCLVQLICSCVRLERVGGEEGHLAVMVGRLNDAHLCLGLCRPGRMRSPVALRGRLVKMCRWVGDQLCVGSTRIILVVYLVLWPEASYAACYLVCAHPSFIASMLFVCWRSTSELCVDPLSGLRV